MPEDWLMSRLCEEFPGRLPSEIEQEPDFWRLLYITEMRAYARARQIVKTTKNLDDLPDDPMIALVQQNEWDIAKEARAARAAKRQK